MDAAQIILDIMDEWQAGIDAHDPARVAAVFTEDAVFQGLRPYGVGRTRSPTTTTPSPPA